MNETMPVIFYLDQMDVRAPDRSVLRLQWMTKIMFIMFYLDQTDVEVAGQKALRLRWTKGIKQTIK